MRESRNFTRLGFTRTRWGLKRT